MPELLTVRVAGSADLSAIDALLARTYPILLRPDYPPSTMVLALPLISRANPRLVASGSYYVVEERGEVVGAGGWSLTPPGGSPRGGGHRRTGHVRHVVTDHRQVRRGIGRALMARIFNDARAEGVGAMECQSTRTAVPFYAACGFAALGPIVVTLAPGIEFPAVRMARRLPR